MKKLRNNKGITGVDITASIVIILIAIGIISTMYSKYINNSKKIKRNTEATNLAMDFVEYIQKTDFDTINDVFEEYLTIDRKNNKIYEITAKAEDDLIDIFGIEVKEGVTEIPSGYSVLLTKKEEIDGIAMKINVEVSYYITYEQEEKISLSTIKTKLINQVNPPDMESEEVKSSFKDGNTRFVLKYSNTKKGYVQAKISDDDWYSISGKRYPLVVYAKEQDFDVNGVIDLEKFEEIYLWVPRFGKLSTTDDYGFCYNKTNNRIIFGDTEKDVVTKDPADETVVYYDDIIGYTVDTSEELIEIPTEFENATGKWVKVNKDLNPIDNSGNEITDENNILNILKMQLFTWE